MQCVQESGSGMCYFSVGGQTAQPQAFFLTFCSRGRNLGVLQPGTSNVIESLNRSVGLIFFLSPALPPIWHFQELTAQWDRLSE